MKSIVNSINSSNIMKNDLLFSFEPEVIVEWMDPYDLIILKLIQGYITRLVLPLLLSTYLLAL